MTISLLIVCLEQEKRLRCTCPVGKWVICFPCPTCNSTCPLGKLERTERTSVFYGLSRKIYMCKNYVLNVYLSFGRVNTNSQLSHRQNNLSRMSGHCFSHPDDVTHAKKEEYHSLSAWSHRQHAVELSWLPVVSSCELQSNPVGWPW